MFLALQEIQAVQQQLQVTKHLTQSVHTPQKSTDRRMRNLMTLRQLKDIAAVQKERIQQLEAEMQKWRMRSYPAFVDQRPLYPDQRE